MSSFLFRRRFKKLYHGSSDRYGVVAAGDVIVSSTVLDIDPNHDPQEFPLAAGYAFATASKRWAQNYANWAAYGGEHEVSATPVVYQVDVPSDLESDHPYGAGSFKSRLGFPVRKRIEVSNFVCSPYRRFLMRFAATRQHS